MNLFSFTSSLISQCTMKNIFHTRTLIQIFESGNKSVAYIVFILSFMGIIMIEQTGRQIQVLFGDFNALGPIYFELLIREFGPVLTAIVIAAKTGAGISAEIASKKITEQLDAMKLCGQNPFATLYIPKIAGTIATLPFLWIFGCMASYASAGITAHILFEVAYDTFFSARALDFIDIHFGMIKTIVFGTAIGFISCYYGDSAFGGSFGVGQATTFAVVYSSLLVLMLNFIIDLIFIYWF